MPFGKYEGDYIGDLPDDYIQWLAEKAKIKSEELTEKVDLLYNMNIKGLNYGWENPIEEYLQEYSLGLLIYVYRKIYRDKQWLPPSISSKVIENFQKSIINVN